MRLHRTPVLRRRGGFTLVELIVVIAIIAVLISLIASGVFSAFEKMWEVQDRQEITALSNSVSQFEKDNNVSVPPPSRIWLDGSGPTAYTAPPAGYTMNQVQQLGIDSQAYLRKVWPRINISAGIPWNSGVNGRSNNVVLEGEECLVFFLGGAQDPATGSFIGFSTDASNPMNPNPKIKRKGPYFEFVMKRVVNNGPDGYPVYYDTYTQGTSGALVGQVYAYFSSGKTANGYNAYFNAIGYDCPSLKTPTAGGPVPIQPYYQPAGANSPIQFYHPDTYQIISAGKNAVFGPGGAWTSATATAIGPAGADDLADFTNRKLGIPQ